jgi:hypothetical protein
MFLLLVLPGREIPAQTVSMVAAVDTSLFEAAPGNSLGASDSMAVGGTGHDQVGRGLLRFDVTKSRPEGATLVGARLEFTITKMPVGGVPSVIHVHRVLKGWSEGGGQGNLGTPAAAGDSTWLHRSHPNVPWGAPGGALGEDYLPASRGSVRVDGLGVYAVSSAALVEDVQAWIDDPSVNHGWMLRSDAETEPFSGRRVGTRESAAAPRLILEFQPSGPVRPVLKGWGRVGDRFELRFAGEAGNIYQVESLDPGIPGAMWEIRTNLMVKLLPREVTYSEPLAESPARLYRVADVGDVD